MMLASYILFFATMYTDSYFNVHTFISWVFGYFFSSDSITIKIVWYMAGQDRYVTKTKTLVQKVGTPHQLIML
jgi:hypothetical protein